MRAFQVRNKAISKRETEKTIKEIWKEKMLENRTGKSTDLGEFMYNFFQKRVGISTAVTEVWLSWWACDGLRSI